MSTIYKTQLQNSVDIGLQVEELNNEVERLKSELQKLQNSKKVFVHHKGVKSLIAVHEIILVEAQSNYSYIYLINGDKLFTSKTLKYWQEKIASDSFLRIHASFLVNEFYIIAIDRKENFALLKNNHKAKISKQAFKRLISLFE